MEIYCTVDIEFEDNRKTKCIKLISIPSETRRDYCHGNEYRPTELLAVILQNLQNSNTGWWSRWWRGKSKDERQAGGRVEWGKKWGESEGVVLEEEKMTEWWEWGKVRGIVRWGRRRGRESAGVPRSLSVPAMQPPVQSLPLRPSTPLPPPPPLSVYECVSHFSSSSLCHCRPPLVAHPHLVPGG